MKVRIHEGFASAALAFALMTGSAHADHFTKAEADACALEAQEAKNTVIAIIDAGVGILGKADKIERGLTMKLDGAATKLYSAGMKIEVGKHADAIVKVTEASDKVTEYFQSVYDLRNPPGGNAKINDQAKLALDGAVDGLVHCIVVDLGGPEPAMP